MTRRLAAAPSGESEFLAMHSLVDQLVKLVAPATVVVGIGNDLRGDDGAGVAAARALAGIVPWDVLDAGSAPESFLGPIARRAPDCILLIDAMDLAAAPGTIRIMDAAGIDGQGPSTHGPAPGAFLEALAAACPCRCVVVGIQPRQVEFGAPLSPAVAEAVRSLTEALQRAAAELCGQASPHTR